MSETDGTCIAVVGCKRPRLHGYVCGGHFQRASDMLREIEEETALISAVPSMQMHSGPGGSLASHRSPARLNALVHRDPRHGTGMSEDEEDEMAAGQTMSVLGTLHSWARLMREERDLAAPDQVTVVGERSALARHLEWVVAQPWVDEFYRDVSQLLNQLRSANGHRPERPYSKCPVVTDGAYCSGEVWIQDEPQPVWRRYVDRCEQRWEQAPGAAVCDTCGAAWKDDAAKARLKRMVADTAAELARPQTEDGREMWTAQELVDAGRVSTVSNVRVQAHRRGVSAVNGHYDPDWFTSAREIA